MYDDSSGQIFTEWSVPRQSIAVHSGERDWSRLRPYPLLTPRGAHGTRSLVDTTINVIANNIGCMNVELLDSIPTRLLWRIWRFLEARLV